MTDVSSERGDILVVDDQLVNLRFLTATLTRQGYKVRPAISGQLAIETVKKSAPDLILLDIMMPGMDGYAVCEQLKELSVAREIPVIFLSALDKPQDKVRAFAAGAVDYITKPFHVNEVVARVETHLALRAMQTQLSDKNAQLKQEISERVKAEEKLKAYQDQLEELVKERTTELTAANEQLQQEITKRKETANQLQESQQFLQSSLDALSANICILDENGIILAVNESWKTFGDENGFTWNNYGIGYSYFSSARQVDGKITDAVAHIFDAIKDIIQRKQDTFWTTYACHSPEKKRWFSMRISRFEGVSGVRIVISHESVTEQKLAEETLRESENILRTVINATRDGIIAIDEQGLITLYNPAAETIFGYAPDEMLGQALDSLIPENMRKMHSNYVSRFLAGEKPARVVGTTVEFVAQRRNGEYFPMEIALTTGQSDTQRLVVGLVRDITARKKEEEERRQRENFLALLNDITRATLETSDLKTVLNILATQLGQLFDADNVYLTMWDEQKRIARAITAYSAEPQEFTPLQSSPDEMTLTAAVLNAQKPIYVKDIKNSPFLANPVDAMFPDVSMLGLPLIAGQQKLGAALVGFLEAHQFTSAEIARGEQVARQIALAIAKTRLLEETQLRWREAETLRKAAEAITQSLSLNERMEVILEQLFQVLPYDSASVQLLRENDMEIVEGRGFANRGEVIGLRFPVSGDNVNAEIVKNKAPLVLGNVATKYSHCFEFPHEHVVSWLGVPLIVQDRLIGMLTVDSIVPNYFTQEHVRLVVPFANQVAAALENAQLYEQARQDAKTKATLLKEVNHRVKNNLSAIIGLLYAERRHAGIKDDDIYQGIMNGLINRIRGLASVHNMLSASEWSPLRLSEMTTQLINTSLQMLPRDKRAMVSVTASDVLVSSKQANNLALAINELATNTIKHATTGRDSVAITVDIEHTDNQITLIYRDDGPGYPDTVLERHQTNLGLYLVETLITGGMRGQIFLSNNNGAETIIKFGADNSPAVGRGD